MPGTTSTALPSFSHDQCHKTDVAKQKGGGASIIHNKYTQEKPRINRQDETEDHIPRICLPQGDLPEIHSRYTHRSRALLGDPLGVFHPYL